MRVGFVQFAPTLGNQNLTITKLDTLLKEGKEADLLVLPELCNSGYCFESRQQALNLSESIDNSEFKSFLEEKCRQYNFYIASGFCEREGSHIYNSSILVGPRGYIGIYRKLHLFLNEQDYFAPGNLGLPIFDIGHCKVGMLICFDWTFPEVWRILALKGADIICHPSNLVLPGFCQKAVPAHSIFNRIFVVTSNRIGVERDLTFTGMSIISDPKGNVLVKASEDQEDVKFVEINIAQARDKNITLRNNLFNDRRVDEYSDLLNVADGAKNNCS